MAGTSIDEAIDDLYGRPARDFVTARDQLVKTLKKEGDREGAAAVAALRRPSAAAWAVNQLVRRRRSELEQLIALGAALREAQSNAMAGADAHELRAAARARREAVAAMADVAAAIVAEEGSSPAAHRHAILATLDAATLDPEAGEAVRAGRLTSEIEPPSGFGDEAEVAPRQAPGPAREAAAPGADVRKAAGDAAARARRRHDALNEEAVAAAGRAETARRAAEQARAEAADLERRLEVAGKRARELSGEADAAKRVAAKAEAAAAGAADQLAQAEQRLGELSAREGGGQ